MREQRLRAGLWWTTFVGLAFGLSAVIAGPANSSLAIVLAATGGAATVWLLQTTLVALSDVDLGLAQASRDDGQTTGSEPARMRAIAAAVPLLENVVRGEGGAGAQGQGGTRTAS